uniref:Prepilin-type N-terminal cleavage/methylation domain-containing protein n=1 Tax=Candidatus Kentrum sp. DK TaxID=2126562 RepID=A0A450SJ52_9GAMM|nr:MAG: prepilin-type N-terminal cleavage/methylation domain-containing protein [Candidatus Kentron sp. DK]
MSKTAPGVGKGFTLVEMALVMAIISLLLGGLLLPLGTQLENRRIRDTERQLAEIREALMGFAITERAPRLPCPDVDGDGLEDPAAPGTAASCRQGEGALPWATLGLFRKDAWGRGFRYAPDDAYAAPEGVSARPDTRTGLRVRDYVGAALTDWTPASPPGPPPNGPAAVVFSCGPDGIPNGENDNDGAPNPNADCANPGASDGLYLANSPIKGAFDDRLIWLSRNTLLNRLVSAGVWP